MLPAGLMPAMMDVHAYPSPFYAVRARMMSVVSSSSAANHKLHARHVFTLTTIKEIGYIG